MLPKQTPDRIIGTGKGDLTFDGSGQNLAGLVIGIMAGNYTSISLWNVNGASGNPVYFCNYGGQVVINGSQTIDSAFQMGTCNFWEVTGQGIGQGAVVFGIQCNGGGTGSFNAHYGCSDGNINFVEAGKGSKYAGLIFRTYPNTSEGTTFNVKAGWVQKNTVIHDCYIHDCPGEGMYVGTSHYGNIDYNAYEPVAKNPLNGSCTWNGAGAICGGQEAPLINCKIYNNRVENTGLDGIQVGGCIQGLEVRNNKIVGYGNQGVDGDNGGITLNPGCVGIVDSNFVDGKNGNNECVMYQAQGDTQITNNIFVNSGWGLRLLRNTYYNVSGSTHINILIANNTIANCKIGYDWFGANFPVNSVTMENNIVACATIFTVSNGTIGAMIKIANFENTNPASPLFTNAAAGDYSLLPASPCIGKGQNVAGVTNDYNGNVRTLPFDQGAIMFKSTGPVNQPPVVNAGTNQTITLPNTGTNLSGSATDADGTVAGVQWTQVSGPNTAIIASATSSTTAISGLVQGIYIFKLTATDNLGAQGTGQVTITVNSAAVNQPPVASAGPNQTVTLPTSTATLNGSGSTDPDGSVAAYAWTKVSGPGTQTITGATTVRPTVSGLVAGVYVFQLKVTDNLGASATATTQVTVNPVPTVALKSVVSTLSSLVTYSDNTTKTNVTTQTNQ